MSLDVVLRDRGDQHAGRALVVDEIIAQRVDRVLRRARPRARAMVRPAYCGRLRRDRNLHAVPGRDAAPVVEAVARDVGADARARLRLPQPLEHRRHAAGLHPLRQQVLQRIGAGGVGVGVAIDVEAARPGVGDHLQRGRGLAPVVDAGALEVHDLDMDAARARRCRSPPATASSTLFDSSRRWVK